jgi:large subunit ribosomal protein L19
MKQCKVIQQLEEGFLKDNVPNFRVGDTVSVHTKIIEGEKERLQVFTGTVIARKGSGLSETFSIYRVAYGSGMERVFLIHSPRVAKIEIVKIGKVRKGKLYYLRGASGKAAKVKEYIGPSKRSIELNAAK